MSNSAYLQQIEKARHEAEQILAEGRTRGFPIGMSVCAVRVWFGREGLPVPDDVLAFASRGMTSDCMITDWGSIDGGPSAK